MTSRGSAYITGTSSFLPNAPVANADIELGEGARVLKGFVLAESRALLAEIERRVGPTHLRDLTRTA